MDSATSAIDLRPALLAVASAVQNNAVSGVIRMPSPASLISLASSFLPSHSGVRPTISPPMNTASRTYRRIEYSPVPTPPKITSLADRLAKGTAPPIPVNDSIALFTAPHEVTVVTTSNSAEPAIPKRCSLPSRLPPVGAGDHVRVQTGGVLRR